MRLVLSELREIRSKHIEVAQNGSPCVTGMPAGRERIEPGGRVVTPPPWDPAQRLTSLVPTRRARSQAGAHDFPRQTKLLQCAYDQEYPIEFPAAMAMSRGARVRMVIVVPAFAAR